MIQASILVVEDNRVVARDIEEQLVRIGHTVVGITGRGEDAVVKADTTRPHLVLMDIHLDGAIDGIEAAREIRDRYEIPVVYLTAYADDETLQRAGATEPLGYLVKPFQESQLRTAVEMALYKHGADRRLRDSERRYAVTLSSIGDAVIATDAQMRVIFINPAASTLTGWPKREALGRDLGEVFRIFNEDSLEPVEDPATKVLRLGTVVGLANHTALRARDGRVIPIDDCASPIVEDHGEITGVVLVFRDVTLRRQGAEAESLRESHARIDRAVRGSKVGIWEIELADPPWDPPRAAHFWNVWEPLGLAEPPAIPDLQPTLAGAIHPDDLPSAVAAAHACLTGQADHGTSEHRIRHADGSYRWMLARGVVTRDAGGQPIRLSGATVDITDRKLAEAALIETRRREPPG